MVWLVLSSDQLYPSAVTWQSPVAPDLEMSWHVWCPPYTRVAAHVSPTLCTRNRGIMSIWPYHMEYWSMQSRKMHEMKFWTLFEMYLSKPYRGPKSNYGPSWNYTTCINLYGQYSWVECLTVCQGFLHMYMLAGWSIKYMYMYQLYNTWIEALFNNLML